LREHGASQTGCDAFLFFSVAAREGGYGKRKSNTLPD
jgi:hypothetical protein